jgi:hypothetical protein
MEPYPYPYYKHGSGGVEHGYCNGHGKSSNTYPQAKQAKQAKQNELVMMVVNSGRHLCICNRTGVGVTVTTIELAATGKWDETTSMQLMIRDWEDDGEDLPKLGTPVEITAEGKWKVWK